MAEMIRKFFVSMRCAVPRNVFDMTAGADRSDEVLVYADGVSPHQADAEAIYSDWCAVGDSLLDATMRMSSRFLVGAWFCNYGGPLVLYDYRDSLGNSLF